TTQTCESTNQITATADVLVRSRGGLWEHGAWLGLDSGELAAPLVQVIQGA
ncbi:hypothetical protein RRG08_010623, partial [Elysia crispata]